MKQVLNRIIDCSIEIPNTNSISSQVTERKNGFIELVFTLQKLAKELRNIAMTDNLKNKLDLNSLQINGEFINDLKNLSQNLEDIQKLDANKNPLNNIPRKKIDLNQNPVISGIYESIRSNRF